MAIYQLTVNTEKYNVKQCSSKNWKPGTQNDYMQAINGIQRDLKNIQEVEWQLELFQGNFRMGMNDTEKLDSYNRFLEENIITYHDKICDLDRKQFLSGYGCMPGTYKPNIRNVAFDSQRRRVCIDTSDGIIYFDPDNNNWFSSTVNVNTIDLQGLYQDASNYIQQDLSSYRG